MDNAILKKRLNTFKSDGGKLNQVSDEVVMEVLRAWENWPGKTVDLYRELGLSKMQMVIMIKKGKSLIKRGIVTESEFKELKVAANDVMSSGTGCGIELMWDGGKVIRFGAVDTLIDFLKKAA